MTTKSLLISIGCVLIPAGGLFAQVIGDDPQAIDIKLRYQPGKTYSVVTEMRTKTEMEIGGETMNNDQLITFFSDNKVTSIDGSENLNLHVSYTRVAMVMDIMGQRIVYDSADESPDEDVDELTEAIGELVGKKLTMEVTPDLKVTKIEGLEAIFNNGQFRQMDDETLKAMKQEQVEMYSGMQFSVVVPEKPVREGDEWPYSTSMTVPMVGSLNVSGVSTLREVSLVGDRLHAVVEMTAKGKIVADNENAEEEEGDGAAEIEADQPVAGQVKKMNLKGRYVIDVLDGYVVEAAVESDSVFMMNIGGGAGPMELPMKNVTKTLTSME